MFLNNISKLLKLEILDYNFVITIFLTNYITDAGLFIFIKN